MSQKRIKTQPLDSYVGPVNCWKSLGIAITKQAIIDWSAATRKLSVSGSKSREVLALKNSCESFLSSSRCEWYSGLDGKTLLRKLKSGEL